MRHPLMGLIACLLFPALAFGQGPQAITWQSKSLEGGYQLLIPAAVDPAHPVSVMIGPPEARTGALAAWFDERVAIWASGIGLAVERLSPMGARSGFSERTMAARMRGGRLISIHFTAYETQTQRRLLGVIYDTSLTPSNAQVAAGIDLSARMATSLSMQTASIPAAPVAAPSPIGSNLASAFGAPNVERAPWLRVGRGVGDDAVQMVLPHVWCGAGYGGYRCTPYIYIFLKDGRVFDNIYASPRDFDPAAARGQIDEGRWRASGGDAVISWATGSQARETIKGAIHLGGRASTNARIAGRFSADSARTVVNALGLPSDYGAAASVFTFRADGTFDEQSSVGSYGASGPGAVSDISHGQYRIAGFTIEFAYSDGRRDNRIFSILASRNQRINAFVLGDHAFGRD